MNSDLNLSVSEREAIVDEFDLSVLSLNFGNVSARANTSDKATRDPILLATILTQVA